jgi:hypothetical protein
MSDIETKLTNALHEQAHAAAHGGSAMDSHAFDLLSGPVGRRRTVRRPIALAGSVLATVAAIVAATVAAGSTNATHNTTGKAARAQAAAPQSSAPGPYGIPAGHFLKVTSGIQTIWIPSDMTATWKLHRDDDGGGPQDETARCAAFAFFGGRTDANGNAIPGSVPGCTAAARWNEFRPQFTESLPSDPGAILRSLENGLPAQDTPAQRADDAYSRAEGYLSMGVVSDHAAREIEAAVKLIPGVTATPHVSNGAGGFGELIAIPVRIKKTASFEVRGLVVDPATGRVEASYDKLPPQTFTTDPRTGVRLSAPETRPGLTTITAIRYEVVTSLS